MREDDGSGAIAQQFDGLSYAALFTGANPNIPDELRLPPGFRVFIGSASDQEILGAVVKVVAAYVNGLRFSQTDDAGNLIRSPLDVFLSRNGLPQQPNSGETPLDYSRRLLTLVNGLASPQFVTRNPNNPSLNGNFQFHSPQLFVFGVQELAGLKIFLTEPAIPPTASLAEEVAGKVGNCLACHAAPNFTAFKLHNTGIAQKEYDDIHAPTNTFAGLFIPPLTTRDAGNYNLHLPTTEVPAHQNALEPFRSIPVAGNPSLTDLGVWNIFLNPDMPNPQAKIKAILCDDQVPCPLSDAALLDMAIARFKALASAIWGTRLPTCIMACSIHWTMPSGSISVHRARHGRELFVTAPPRCKVLPYLRQILHPLWRSSSLSMRTINRRNQRKQEQPAGTRHTQQSGGCAAPTSRAGVLTSF